jgi:hypothetical protein
LAGDAAAAEAVMVASAEHRDRNDRSGAVQGCPDVATTRAMVSRRRSCVGLMVPAAGVVGVGGSGNGVRPRDCDRLTLATMEANPTINVDIDIKVDIDSRVVAAVCTLSPPLPPNIKLIPPPRRKELWLPWPLGAVRGDYQRFAKMERRQRQLQHQGGVGGGGGDGGGGGGGRAW